MSTPHQPPPAPPRPARAQPAPGERGQTSRRETLEQLLVERYGDLARRTVPRQEVRR